MIIQLGPEVCKSVRQFFELNGRIEVERPSRCPRRKEECGSTEPMRKNGSYSRQVIYWGMLLVLEFHRIFDRENMLQAVLVDPVDHGCESR